MPRACRLCGFEELPSSFGGTTGVGERVAESDFQIDCVRRARHQLDRVAIKQSGAIESQRARRLARSRLGMDRRAILFAGAQIVFIKRFRIVQSARLERLGEAAVNLAALVLRQQRGQRFADALVVKLDSISRAAAAHQLRGSERIEKLLILALRTRRTDRDVFINGPAGHRERVEKLL